MLPTRRRTHLLSRNSKQDHTRRANRSARRIFLPYEPYLLSANVKHCRIAGRLTCQDTNGLGTSGERVWKLHFDAVDAGGAGQQTRGEGSNRGVTDLDLDGNPHG